jgi:hypothetical protein
MKIERKIFFAFVAGVALAIAGGPANASGPNAPVELDEARIIIEMNSTDEDVGIQIFFDGGPWRRMTVKDPNGKIIFDVEGIANLRKQGLTELFFESEEPSLDDVPLAEFLARFPEGEYEFSGVTLDGQKLVGTATFTHSIPDGPSIVTPAKRGAEVDPKKAVIEWDPVVTPSGIQIVAYQVIVEGGKPARTFSVHLPATATKVTIPREFLEPGRRYKFEVLAIEVGGNQTITESFFRTGP